MRLRRLDIRRMPGLDERMTLDFDDGMNIITGPNGSGKSTICRAVAALLWPMRDTPEPLSVAATWRDGDIDWHSERHEGQTSTTWQKNGAPATRPELPDIQLASCFFLRITDLIKPDGDRGDEDLAQLIHRQMAGGFDITAVGADYFSPGKRHTHAPFKDFETCRTEKRRLRLERADLARREDSLADLEEELAEAGRALCRLELLRTTSSLLADRARFAELQIQLGAFPPAMTRIDGGELKRLEDLRLEATQEQSNLADASRGSTATEAEILRLDLHEVELDTSALAGWLERSRGLGELRTDRRRLEQEYAGARSRLEDLADELEMDESPSLPRSLPPGLAKEARQILTEKAADEHYLANLDDLLVDGPLKTEENPGDVEKLEDGLRLLKHWRDATGLPHARTRAGTWTAWCLLLAAGLALGLAGESVAGWRAGLPVSLAALCGALFQFLLDRRRATALRRNLNEDRDNLRKRYDGLDLPSPEAWTEFDVETTRRKLEAARLEAEKAAMKLDLRGALAGRRERLLERVPQLEKQLDELRQKHGAAPGSGQDLGDFLNSVTAFRAVEAEIIDLRAREGEANRVLDEELGAINVFLEQCRCAPAVNTVDAHGRLQELSRRYEDHLHAVARLAESRESEKLCARRCSDIEARINALYEKLELEPDDLPALTGLVEGHEDWKKMTAERDHCRRDIERQEAHLASAPELMSLSETEITQEIETASALGEKRDALLEKRGSLLVQLEAANTDGRFAEACVKTSRAADRLLEERRLDLHASAGMFLLERVRRKHESETRPEVLRKAQRYFADFTRSRWWLKIVEAPGTTPRFRAVDNTSRLSLDLEQLSDGTRAQLLLAVKLAFTDTAAGPVDVPLFLDESLAAADPDRFDAVATSLSTLSSDPRRQLFYLTSDPSDCEAWLRARRRSGLPEITARRLERRSTAGRSDQPIPSPAGLRAVPAPSTHDAASYARALDVPRFDPVGPVEDVHLWYLLHDDLDLLYRLLREWGLEKVGPYRRWAGEFGEAVGKDWAGLAKLDDRVRILIAFLRIWREGRPRRLDRSGLVNLVSESFRDRIDERLIACNGDANALIESLADQKTRVPRFGDSRIEKLKEALSAAGYLDYREKVPAQRITESVQGLLKTELAGEKIDPADCTATVAWLQLSCA